MNGIEAAHVVSEETIWMKLSTSMSTDPMRTEHLLSTYLWRLPNHNINLVILKKGPQRITQLRCHTNV